MEQRPFWDAVGHVAGQEEPQRFKEPTIFFTKFSQESTFPRVLNYSYLNQAHIVTLSF
jgi:hypothetical protein